MKQQATNILASQDNQCTCMYHYVSVSRYVTAPYAPQQSPEVHTSGLFCFARDEPLQDLPRLARRKQTAQYEPSVLSFAPTVVK